MTNNSMAFVAISSTMVDLNAHREAAIEACLRMRFQPLVLESFAATNQQSLDTALDLINRADIYLGIFGFRYGYIPAGYEKSIIELEYERAGERGIPRLVFFMSDQHPIKVQDVEVGEGAEKLKQLKEQIARTAIVAFFSSPEELRLKIVESLLRYQTERSEPKKALLLIPFAAKYEQLREQLTETLYTLGFAVARFDNRV